MRFLRKKYIIPSALITLVVASYALYQFKDDIQLLRYGYRVKQYDSEFLPAVGQLTSDNLGMLNFLKFKGADFSVTPGTEGEALFNYLLFTRAPPQGDLNCSRYDGSALIKCMMVEGREDELVPRLKNISATSYSDFLNLVALCLMTDSTSLCHEVVCPRFEKFSQLRPPEKLCDMKAFSDVNYFCGGDASWHFKTLEMVPTNLEEYYCYGSTYLMLKQILEGSVPR